MQATQALENQQPQKPKAKRKAKGGNGIVARKRKRLAFKLQVAHTTIKVYLVDADHPLLANGGTTYNHAIFYSNDLVIAISNALTPEQLDAYMWHELTHALIEIHRMRHLVKGLGERAEEDLCNAMGPALAQTMAANGWRLWPKWKKR